MEKILQQILKEVQNLKEDVSALKVEVSMMKAEVSMIKTDMATKTQQDENSSYIQSLLHNTEELDAKFDGLLHNTASKESLARVEKSIDDIGADLSFLVRKAAKHDDDIRNLRKAQ